MFTLKSSQITLASPIFAELCPYYSLFYNQISFPTKIISPRVPSTCKAGKPCLVRLVWGPYSVPLPFPGGALFGQWRSTRSDLGRGHAILLRFAFETHRPLSCKKKPWPTGRDQERALENVDQAHSCYLTGLRCTIGELNWGLSRTYD